jgi:predicted ATPase
MKIVKLEIQEHPFFSKIEFDFRESNGDIADTIIIAGENGLGKTRLLDLISSIVERENINNITKFSSEIQLNEDEKEKSIAYLNQIGAIPQMITYLQSNKYQKFVFDNTNKVIMSGVVFSETDFMHPIPFLNIVSKIIYSPSEIQFSFQNVRSIGASELDKKTFGVEKHPESLGQYVTQLLVDIKSQDNADLANWVQAHPGKPVPTKICNQRTKRFQNAFSIMFPTKRFKEVRVVDGSHHAIFEAYGKPVLLKDLSSGEKQIVLRASHILKNQQANQGAIILLDEPELGLHPGWQERILEFYRSLVTYPDGQNQLIVVTHSPFIVHDNSPGVRVIVLVRDEKTGSVIVDPAPTFYEIPHRSRVARALNVEGLLLGNPERIVITEGESDVKILEVAWGKLHPGKPMPFVIRTSGINGQTGNAAEVAQTLERLAEFAPENRRVVGLFDNDMEGNNRLRGLQSARGFTEFDLTNSRIRNHTTAKVTALLIPVPPGRELLVNPHPNDCYLAIEHYFSNTVLSKDKLKGDERISGTGIFSILDGKKTDFAMNSVAKLPVSEFVHFEALFKELLQFLT